MTDVAIFLTDVGATAAASAAVVVYLQPHLKAVLVDLCGTVERAKFWTAFSNVTLMLSPLVFAMGYRPQIGTDSAAIFEMGTQLKWALIGLVVSVVMLGLVIGSFIPRSRPGASLQSQQPFQS
jgi:uncharacterized membrane protein YhaH (DUF805 family)